MKRFEVYFYEDEFCCVAQTIIECNDENELKQLVDAYYEEHLKDKNVAGAKWNEIE